MNDIKKFEPLWGSWYIKNLLGEGGYGKVYKIERSEYGIKYESALKHIRIPHSQSELKSIMIDGMDEKSITSYFENFIGEIVKEFALMSKLKGNSNIVSYEDHKIEKADDKPQWDIFIRMELLTSLVDYISAENDIRKKTIIKLGIDICKALEVCQKHNIIHRDIKPENIFISENGDFKLGDFGIARQIDKTMSGLSKKGTFTYIAPEVYKGEAYGSTVDIYSLGLVMYRLLNNNRMPFMPPYPEKITYNDREIALAKRMSGQEMPMPINAEGRLGEIVLKACSYNYKERYDNPNEMRRALENILYKGEESKIIYPEGDNLEIKSANYIGIEDAETEVMSVKDMSQYDETVAMTVVPKIKETAISHVEENKTETKPVEEENKTEINPVEEKKTDVKSAAAKARETEPVVTKEKKQQPYTKWDEKDNDSYNDNSVGEKKITDFLSYMPIVVVVLAIFLISGIYCYSIITEKSIYSDVTMKNSTLPSVNSYILQNSVDLSDSVNFVANDNTYDVKLLFSSKYIYDVGRYYDTGSKYLKIYLKPEGIEYINNSVVFDVGTRNSVIPISVYLYKQLAHDNLELHIDDMDNGVITKDSVMWVTGIPNVQAIALLNKITIEIGRTYAAYPRTYIIQPGDTPHKICTAVYGNYTGQHWEDLKQANLRYGNNWVPGEVVKVLR